MSDSQNAGSTFGLVNYLDNASVFGANQLPDVLGLVQSKLQQAAASPDLFVQVFGDKANTSEFQTVIKQWSVGDFSQLPSVQILSAANMNGNYGGYDKITNNIYLSSDLFSSKTMSIDSVFGPEGVWTEEIGHYLDRFGADTLGDEGEKFRNFVFGYKPSAFELASIDTEDDRGLINVNGQSISVEMNGLNLSTVESIGNTKLVRDTANFLYAQVGTNTPTSIKFNGQAISSNSFAGWQTLGVETIGGQNRVLWKNVVDNTVSVWQTDSNWNYVSAPVAGAALNSSTALNQETAFGLDLNGDNILGNTFSNVESIGNAKLVRDSSNFLYAQVGTSTPIAIKLSGQPIYINNFAGWQVLAVETVNGQNQVLWKNVVDNTVSVWQTDSNWNYVSAPVAGAALNSSTALNQETAFGLDLNGDNSLGNTFSNVEAIGNTKLVRDSSNFLYAQVGTSTPVAIKLSGQPIYINNFAGWQVLAVETVNGQNQVLWKNVVDNTLSVWQTDSNWNYVSAPVAGAALNSSTALNQESIFGLDLNGDNSLGNTFSNVEAIGNTKLVKDSANFLYAQVGTSTPIAIKLSGQPIYINNFAGWQVLAVETVNGQNQVLWKNVFNNTISVWQTDSNWNYVSAPVAGVALNSSTALNQETAFGLDLDNNGIVGVLPVVTIAASDSSAGEVITGQVQNPGLFTLTRSGNIASALTVGYTISGTATNGADYSALSGTVTFAAGNSNAVVNLNVIDDGVFEGNETVALTLVANAAYTLGTGTSGTVTIADNDLPTITVVANDNSAAEVVAGQIQNPGQFTLSRTGSTANALTVGYAIAGTATNGSDYSNLNGTVTFAAGSATALVNVNVTDDAIFEGSESVVLTLASNAAYALGAATTATVTIADNDTNSTINHLGLITDFNKDGKTDIFWRKPQDGTNIVRLMNSGSSISDLTIESVPDAALYPVALADFNNDGNIDILWRYHWSQNTGANQIWLMNGSQRIDTIILDSEPNNNWEVVGTGDFDRDGFVDILWRNNDPQNPQIAVWLLNSQYQRTPVFISVPPQDNPGVDWSIKGTGDFNGDGKIDILWRNSNNGEIAVWFMDGLNRSSVSLLAQKEPSSVWDIVGTGDFNGDGKIDIQWRTSTTGENAAWLMNGTTYIGSLNLGVVPTDWTTIGYEKPDLIIQNPVAPSSINVGDSFTISAVTKNIGKAVAVPSSVRYWLSNDTLLDKNSDIPLGQSGVNWLATGNITPTLDGSSQSNSFQVTYNPAWGTGNKFILFEADSSNAAFNESNESNNLAYKAITVSSKIMTLQEFEANRGNWSWYNKPNNPFNSSYTDGSGYHYGNCTWYAHGRMLQLGYSKSALDTMLGDASNWDDTAGNGAYVSITPQVGAIANWNSGHVAVVESVNSDGSILISESNWDQNNDGIYNEIYATRLISQNNKNWPSKFIIVPKA
jgi:surface antigen